MEKILDRDENQEKKDDSWLVVIVANILIAGMASLYAIFTSGSSFIFQSISGFLVMINSILLFISFYYHKNYWKKWLLMVIIGVILFLIGL